MGASLDDQSAFPNRGNQIFYVKLFQCLDLYQHKMSLLNLQIPKVFYTQDHVKLPLTPNVTTYHLFYTLCNHVFYEIALSSFK